MIKFAFISRHEPTQGQHQLAQDQGIALEWIGDLDAFEVTDEEVASQGDFDGVVVVHPAAAMRLAATYFVGVFKNANRAPVGEKPRFEAEAFEVYDLRG